MLVFEVVLFLRRQELILLRLSYYYIRNNNDTIMTKTRLPVDQFYIFLKRKSLNKNRIAKVHVMFYFIQ